MLKVKMPMSNNFRKLASWCIFSSINYSRSKKVNRKRDVFEEMVECYVIRSIILNSLVKTNGLNTYKVANITYDDLSEKYKVLSLKTHTLKEIERLIELFLVDAMNLNYLLYTLNKHVLTALEFNIFLVKRRNTCVIKNERLNSILEIYLLKSFIRENIEFITDNNLEELIKKKFATMLNDESIQILDNITKFIKENNGLEIKLND